MERSWNGRNINLASLATRIASFFTDRDFEVIKGKKPTGYEILAHDSPYLKLLGHVQVSIEGIAQDFKVELELCEEKKGDALFSWRLLTMFGGGYFFLQKLKSDEAWTKLRREFWQFVENAALQLTNSVESSGTHK